MKQIYILFFIFLIGCILIHSNISLAYASLGLTLWFEHMIPALLPFMILSGIMIRMNLVHEVSYIMKPFLYPLFHVSNPVCYAITMGFFCGFPMGAKTTADLLKFNMISREEASFLLAFTNNIGPIYFISYVLPMLGCKLYIPYLFGMYGIPLFYGVLLRYSQFKHLNTIEQLHNNTIKNQNDMFHILCHIDDSILSSIQSILMLGGYMILFNLMNLPFHIFFENFIPYISPFFEISGGIKLQAHKPLYLLLILPFGGLSCFAQTYSCIKDTNLSIKEYLYHKIILTCFTGIYYYLWYFLSPETFLL